ncbi:hypothetical protein DBP12_03325 [Streptomyces sp. CS014]|nr:hypothetical protein DBP12_03325 [Streptomyces sp. CS014]
MPVCPACEADSGKADQYARHMRFNDAVYQAIEVRQIIQCESRALRDAAMEPVLAARRALLACPAWGTNTIPKPKSRWAKPRKKATAKKAAAVR